MGYFKKNKISFKFQVSSFRLMLFFLLVFFMFSYLFLFSYDVRASIGLSVSPQKFDLLVYPGDSYENRFKLTNRSDAALPISIRAMPFGAEEGTGEMRFEKIDPDSPSLWFSFEKQEMILEAGETRSIDFKIEVPFDSEPGGYYVFVYFEPRFPGHYFEKAGPKVIPVIGVPFLISTTPLLLDPEQGKEFEVLNFSISKDERAKVLENFLNTTLNSARYSLASVGVVQARVEKTEVFLTQKTPFSFNVKIKNNDIYHLKPFGTLFVYNIFGKKIGEAELKGQTILPGRSREFNVFIKEEETGFMGRILNLASLGLFKSELDIKALSHVRGELYLTGGNPSLTSFSLTTFYFLIIFAIITIIIYFGRKRIRLALKVLLKK